MFYKAIVDSKVIDVVSEHQCIHYNEKCRAILRCKYKDEPQGFVGVLGDKLYHVEGWPEFPEGVQDRIYATVLITEIDVTEYETLRKIIEAGQTYAEPEIEEEIEEVDTTTLEWAKEQKIALSKKMLATYLETNPIVSTAHGGVKGTYSVTEEKQQLMALNYNTYQIKKAAGLDAELTWNETGQECEVWTEVEYVHLIIEIEAYVKPLVSKQQSFEKQIQEAATLQEVDAIEISY